MHGVNKRGLEPGWPSQGLRVKRAILASRRAGPSTPVPSWKVFNNQLYDGIAAAAAAHAAAGRPTPVSARKLAASLWELQDHPLPACLCSQHWLKGISDMSSPRSQADSYFSPRSCKFAYQQYVKPGSENSKRGGHVGKHLAAMHSHLHEESGNEPDNVASASVTLEGQRHQSSPVFHSRKKNDGKTGEKSMTTSSELLKVLSRIRILEEQHNTSLHLTATLRTELEQARARVQELELMQKSDRREVESIMRRMSDEKASWKAKEQEKITAAVQMVKDELEEERKVKRRIEMANRKMTKELVEANMAAAKALQELEQERKARQLMEDVCDELAREIGDDKAEREELRRESERVREELEEERRMLQLAEVWREERVQMKLSEAKVALEEKSAALDVMRAELEAFLNAGRGSDQNAALQEAQILRNVITAMHPRGIVSSFPPVDNDIYTMDLSTEEQTNGDEAQEGQYWGNPLDSQEVGSRWDESEGEALEASHEARSSAYTRSPEHVSRQNSKDWHIEVAKQGDSGSDFVSESNESDEDEQQNESDREESQWGGHLENEIYHQNGGIVHAQDPEDDVDEYALNEDIVALSRPNGLHVEEGVWREEAHVVQSNVSTLAEDEDDIHAHNLSRVPSGHMNMVSESSPHHRIQLSPDKTNAHIIRGMKGHMEWPKSNIEVMRSKQFEANNERQQLRHR